MRRDFTNENTRAMMKKTEETAYRIKKCREKMGKTQEEMAELAGLSLENYKKIEDGSNAMSMTSLRSVQKALQVPFDYLLEGEVESLEELWYKVNACENKDCVELLIKIIKKVANVEFEEHELTELVADVNKDSYGK